MSIIIWTVEPEKKFETISNDFIERSNAYSYYFDVPGVEADEIDITLSDRILEVKTERKSPGDSEVKFLVHERHTGTSQRKVKIPQNADTEKAETNLRNGVLTVTIPKLSNEVKKLTVNYD